MAKILVGYERGEGIGHYRRLAPVAEALAAESHQVVFFLRNLWDCRAQLTRSPLPFIQSPDLVPPNPAERVPKSLGAYSKTMLYCAVVQMENLVTAHLAIGSTHHSPPAPKAHIA